jgi:YHS domain-containing protein
MWRLIVLAVLLIIIYFLVKSALRGLLGRSKDVVHSVGTGASSELVQDPVCGMYVAREGAYFLRQGDLTYFFCSEACRSSYQKKFSSA